MTKLMSQDELDRSETACRWCFWALVAFAWALAGLGIAAIAGGIWQ